MIYQRLPESPKSDSERINCCSLKSFKHPCYLAATGLVFYLFSAISSSVVGLTRARLFDMTTKKPTKEVSSSFMLYNADFTDEEIKLEEESWEIDMIALLGERHSGTNWITNHLRECFSRDIKVTPHYTRFKHWFQKEALYHGPSKSVVVVAMFRDPYDWVWAMKERPHHGHDHIGLEWLDFVTKPWIGHRGYGDKNITLSGMKDNITCFSQFSFVEVMPCSDLDSSKRAGHGGYRYELFHDGSERAYSSIIDLRKAKIENHLSTSSFNATRVFLPFQYEELLFNGTEMLLSKLEKATGIKRKCKASEPREKVAHKDVPQEYVKWMTKYVDWEVEARIGYFPKTN